MYLGEYDEYLYTAEQAMINQSDDYINNFYPNVVYYQDGKWQVECIKNKFDKYFEMYGRDNVYKIFKTSDAILRE